MVGSADLDLVGRGGRGGSEKEGGWRYQTVDMGIDIFGWYVAVLL